MEILLTNQVTLVTGASHGIGRAIALECAKCGSHVVVNYLTDEEGALKVVKEIAAMGRESIAIRADVSKKNEVTSLIGKTYDEFNRIDVLVNNAGSLIKRASFMDISDELWDSAMEINLKSVFLCSQAVVPFMQRQGAGRIINIGSGTVHTGGGPGALHYAAAKAGVRTLTRGMAKELVSSNILVNGINPGIIATPLQDRFTSPKLRESIKRGIPLQREGLPEEIAAAVAFLASKHSDYIVGEMIEINGGKHMV
jgi:3-oxoacyl-[acyl-carrier protein] reductase